MLVARAWPVALGRRSSAWRPATVRLRAVRCHSTSARGPRESGVAQWEAMPSGGQASVASYLAYLLEVNQSMNLTAVRNLDDAYERHVGDSLALLPVLDEAFASQQLSEGQPLSLMDVGSGCGVPGIILAAARPEWQVTLLDTLRKRTDFVTEAAARSGVQNTRALWARAEDAAQQPEHRQRYAVVTARAVAPMPVLAELCLPLVNLGGFLIAYKGADPEQEVAEAANAIAQCGGTLRSIERVQSLVRERVIRRAALERDEGDGMM